MKMYRNLPVGLRLRAALIGSLLGLAAFSPSALAYDSAWFHDNLGVGINYGNHFESKSNRSQFTGAGLEVVTRTQFDAIKAAGFSHVRLPVCWGYRINWGTTVTVNATFMANVKSSVNNALDAGLVVILNTHHEDWFQKYYGKQNNLPVRFDTTTKDYVTSGSGLRTPMAIYKDIWKDVLNAFDHDSRYDKIIFEGLNEPHSETADPADPLGFSDTDVNALNKEVFNIIQDNENDYVLNGSTVSYRRMCSLSVNNMNNSKSMKALELPDRAGWTDAEERARCMITIHYYHNLNWTHWQKTVQNNWGSATDYTDVATRFKEINSSVSANFNSGARNQALVGVPVNIGEFGVAHDADVNTPNSNEDSRGVGNDQDNDDVLEWYRVVSAFAKHYGYPATAWDDNGYFKIFNRDSGTYPGSFDWSGTSEAAAVSEIWKQVTLFSNRWTLMNVSSPAVNLAASGGADWVAWEVATDASTTLQKFTFVVDPYGLYDDTSLTTIGNTIQYIRYNAIRNEASAAGRYLDVVNDTTPANGAVIRNRDGTTDDHLDHYVFPTYTGGGAFALIIPITSGSANYPQPVTGTKVVHAPATTNGTDVVLYDYTSGDNKQRWVFERAP